MPLWNRIPELILFLILQSKYARRQIGFYRCVSRRDMKYSKVAGTNGCDAVERKAMTNNQTISQELKRKSS